MKKLLFDSRWLGPNGIGVLTQQLLARKDHHFHFDELLGGPDKLGLVNPLWLSLQIQRKNPDVFFTPGFNPPTYSTKPFVFAILDLIHLNFTEETSSFKKLYYAYIVKPSTHKAKYVLTISQFSKKQILDWSGIEENRVKIITLGVAKDFCPTGNLLDPGYPYILYIGNHKPHKNLARLFRAFAQAKINKDVKLLLSGNPSEKVLRFAHTLGIEPRVKFAGLIPPTELPSYYRGAIAFAFPSLFEGFGLPPLEAMASGIPVLTSNTTALPEVVGDAGIMVNPLDVEAIAYGLEKIVEDNQLRAILREKGLERAKLFNWDKTAEIIWSVLREAAR